MKLSKLKIGIIVAMSLIMVQQAFASSVIVSGGADPNRKAAEAEANGGGSKVIGAGVAKAVEDTALQNEKNQFDAASFTGFSKDNQGNWMIKVDGEKLKKDWYFAEDGHRYHADNQGYMQYGLTKIREEGEKGYWYFLEPDPSSPYFGALITDAVCKIQYGNAVADLQISQGGEFPYGAITNAREVAKTLSNGATESFDYLNPAIPVTVYKEQAAQGTVDNNAVLQQMQAQQIAQAQQAQVNQQNNQAKQQLTDDQRGQIILQIQQLNQQILELQALLQ